MAKQVCIAFASGCSRAEVDTAQLFDYFEVNGWQVVDGIEDADLVIVAACAFDSDHEASGIRLFEAADSRRKPGSRLVGVGCAAAIAKGELAERFDIELVAPSDLSALDAITGADVAVGDVPDPQTVAERVGRASDAFTSRERHTSDRTVMSLARRFYNASGIKTLLLGKDHEDCGVPILTDALSIRVARGCVGHCTFCAIRGANGMLRSKPQDVVVAEFEAGLEQGYTDFRLLAQDLGAYGQDLDEDIVGLLRTLFDRPEHFRLSLIDFGTRWLIQYADEIIPLLAENRERIAHLASPVQSGSEAVLAHMHRGHNAADARAALLAAREALAGTPLTTHVLIGFPGETEEDFQATVDLLRAVGFDGVDVYDFSCRPGTAAAGMTDQVPSGVIRDRSRRVRSEFCGRMAGLEYGLRTRFVK